MEKRFNPTRCKVEQRADGKPVIVGYGAVFFRADVPGTEYELWPGVVERVARGAFDGALQRRDDARGLFNHDPSLILGRASAGTMTLKVDETGLRYEIDPPDSDVGKRVIEAINRGDVTGSSFSFSVDQQSWQELPDGKEIRTIEAVSLYDVGPVTFPAYEATTTAVRSVDSARASLESWRRDRQRAAARMRVIELDKD